MFNELDLKTLWQDLDKYSNELDEESATLTEVARKITELRTKTERDMSLLALQVEYTFLPAETVIGFNVSGQLFHVPVDVLTRTDANSLLAACCRAKVSNCPFPPEKDGYFFIPRDWWLFRHIISFLRSHVLPYELETLRELYREASFYRLKTLQKAIEDIPTHQIRNTAVDYHRELTSEGSQ